MKALSKINTCRSGFLLALCLIAQSALAQQDPLTSQYLNNYFIINPAYAGMTKDLSGGTLCQDA